MEVEEFSDPMLQWSQQIFQQFVASRKKEVAPAFLSQLDARSSGFAELKEKMGDPTQEW